MGTAEKGFLILAAQRLNGGLKELNNIHRVINEYLKRQNEFPKSGNDLGILLLAAAEKAGNFEDNIPVVLEAYSTVKHIVVSLSPDTKAFLVLTAVRLDGSFAENFLEVMTHLSDLLKELPENINTGNVPGYIALATAQISPVSNNFGLNIWLARLGYDAMERRTPDHITPAAKGLLLLAAASASSTVDDIVLRQQLIELENSQISLAREAFLSLRDARLTNSVSAAARDVFPDSAEAISQQISFVHTLGGDMTKTTVYALLATNRAFRNRFMQDDQNSDNNYEQVRSNQVNVARAILKSSFGNGRAAVIEKFLEVPEKFILQESIKVAWENSLVELAQKILEGSTSISQEVENNLIAEFKNLDVSQGEMGSAMFDPLYPSSVKLNSPQVVEIIKAAGTYAELKPEQMNALNNLKSGDEKTVTSLLLKNRKFRDSFMFLYNSIFPNERYNTYSYDMQRMKELAAGILILKGVLNNFAEVAEVATQFDNTLQPLQIERFPRENLVSRHVIELAEDALIGFSNAGAAAANQSSPGNDSGSSSLAAPGGIDFDPTNMNLQIKRDGRGVPLPLPQQNVEQINIEGLFPVIIRSIPITPETLPIFLGQAPKEPDREPDLAATSSS